MSASIPQSAISEPGRNYLRLHLAADVGPVRLKRLLAHFGTAEAILSASSAELESVKGIGAGVATSIRKARQSKEPDQEIERARAAGLRILCWEDEDYPPVLRHLPDPPICLFVRGTLLPTDAVALAIVGTRRCSHYGREQAVRFAQLLAQAGFTVVSGLARGIDSHAHQGALQGGGRTIAVLGHGLGQIYPPEHARLADHVAQRGAVVSELPTGIIPDAKNFPRRNRIIAGLCLGVIVIEAGQRSGALITARLASEYNREIFAVPGRIDQPHVTAGVHALIRDGHAKLITSLTDILDELHGVGDMFRDQASTSSAESFAGASSASRGARRSNGPAEETRSAPLSLSSNEKAIVEAIGRGAEDVDAIGLETNLPMGGLMSALTALQLKGLVEQRPGPSFHLRRLMLVEKSEERERIV